MSKLQTMIIGLLCVSITGCPGIVVPPNGSVDSLDTDFSSLPAVAGLTALQKPSTDPAKVALGKSLFFDKLLSGNRNISCSTCHTPTAFTGDGLPLAKGQGGEGLGLSRSALVGDDGSPVLIPRNSPEIFNRGNFTTMFWDARVADNGDGTFTSPAGDRLPEGLDGALAVQAMFPVTSGDEMRGTAGDNELANIAVDDLVSVWAGLMARLLANDEYVSLFAAAYPDVLADDLNFGHAANAIAAFEIEHWTLDDSPFDNYLNGDTSAMSDSAKRGAILFYGSANCSSCHSGSLLTDELFHNRVVPQLGPGKGNDDDGLGDYGRANVTSDDGDRYKFRTPPLRNVAATGPWMHDGAFTTLEAAVRHELDPQTSATNYDASQLPDEFAAVYRGNKTADIIAAADPVDTAAIDLSDSQVADIVSFLQALTSPSIATLSINDIPQSVPSGLPLAD